MNWKPIQTAPRDGTEILGWREDCGALLIRWIAPSGFLSESEMWSLDESSRYAEGWFCADFAQATRMEGDFVPTHWQPLPEGPYADPVVTGRIAELHAENMRFREILRGSDEAIANAILAGDWASYGDTRTEEQMLKVTAWKAERDRALLGMRSGEDPTPPQLCTWELHDDEWKLMVLGRSHAASVWTNGTWHTWNPYGVGGENSSEGTVFEAKIEAAASAIAQGFI
jgi:hypothetical protein